MANLPNRDSQPAPAGGHSDVRELAPERPPAETPHSIRPERIQQLHQTLTALSLSDCGPASVRSRRLAEPVDESPATARAVHSPSDLAVPAQAPAVSRELAPSQHRALAGEPGSVPSSSLRSARLDEETKAEARQSAAARELPVEQLRLGVKHIGWFCLIQIAGLAAFLTLSFAVSDPGFGDEVLASAQPLLLVAMTLSGVMWGLTRITHERPKLGIQLSFAYLLGYCLVLALVRHQQPWQAIELLRSWSPLAPIIVLYGALVPSRPSSMLLTGLAAASTEPLAMFLLGSTADLSTGGAAMLLASPGLGAAMAYVTSRLVHDLSAEVAREREIGSYHLVERLGTGAMGEVWRADHSMLARAAAVKVIRTQALTVDSIEDARNVVNLFELEAQATAALTSPHTIDVYDFGYTKEGLFYYVMELLDGFDLQTLVERDGRQPPERVAHILRQAAESLHEAHEMNYVHRDLKPANIFMCRYGGDVDFAKLLDFGLVLDRNASLEEEDPGVPEPDAGVKLIGTPSVMAPEMLDPHAKIDGRADIYGLGCVGYWLLTGERVFPAETRIAMLRAHARATPQAPSERAGVQIPAELEQLVLECLRKRPGERPQSALEVSERITGLGLANDWDRSRRNRWWDNNATGPLQDRLDR